VTAAAPGEDDKPEPERAAHASILAAEH
jgi:hypothetical protein